MPQANRSRRKSIRQKVERGRGKRGGVRRMWCSMTDSRGGAVNGGGAYLMFVAVFCY
jgi:hypothetical protein